MARLARLIVPGVALHIHHRGNNRQSCFRDRNDRLVYLAILRDLCSKRPCLLHAYCLMTNHVHLMVTPASMDACARLMHDLAGSYVTYFNRRYERSGTLWEGRFGSCLVDSARYVLGCYRYIELNPVRAGMVPAPLAYEWSSARANTGQDSPAALSPHAEYMALGVGDAARQSAYAKLLGMGDDPAITATMREATGGGYPLVGERLKTQLEASGARVERGKPGPRKLSK